MFFVKKKDIKIIAYSLSNTDEAILKQLIEEKKIVPLKDGTFEVFSQEVIRANSLHGEIATKDDYIKVDSTRLPYPVSHDYFINHYQHIKDNEYKPKEVVILAWDMTQEMEEEILFLKEKKGLIIDEDNFEQYYQAPLYGTIEAADKDSKILLYSVEKENDEIVDISFNFITNKAFEETYEILGTRNH